MVVEAEAGTTLDAVDRHIRDLDVGLWEALAIIVEQKLLPARATASPGPPRRTHDPSDTRVSRPFFGAVRSATTAPDAAPAAETHERTRQTASAANGAVLRALLRKMQALTTERGITKAMSATDTPEIDTLLYRLDPHRIPVPGRQYLWTVPTV